MGWSLPLYSLWATNNGPCAHHALLLELLQVLVQSAVLSVHIKVQTVSLNHKVLLDSNTEQHTYSKDSSRVNMTHTHPNTQTCMHARTHRTHTNTQTCRHARTHKTHTHTNTQTCTHARTHRTHTHTNTQTCMHARTHRTHTHTNTQTCMHAHTHRTYTHTNTQTCTHARTHRTHTHTNTQTCTHARTHRTHTHTNTHACIHKTHTHTLHACTHAECQQHSHVSYLSGELRNSLHLLRKLGLLTTLKCLNSLFNTFILNNAGEHQIEPASTRRPLSQWEAVPTNLTLSSCKVFSNLFILPEVLCSLLAVSLSLMLQTR